MRYALLQKFLFANRFKHRPTKSSKKRIEREVSTRPENAWNLKFLRESNPCCSSKKKCSIEITAAGIKVGDTVTKIDGIAVAELTERI
jgi:hypothetical protein